MTLQVVHSIGAKGLPYKSQLKELPSCEIFSENKCNGNDIETASSFEDHRWFTPERGSQNYVSSFQDYAKLAGHVHLVYDDASRTSGKYFHLFM